MSDGRLTSATSLDRFRSAQDAPASGWTAALEEIRRGAQRGHWIWYIFPQLAGLGTSELSRFFAIHEEEEAIAFLHDVELRTRLLTIAAAVADQLKGSRPISLATLFGSDTDARKVVSSLTLFGALAKRLDAAEQPDCYNAIASVADEVLALAARDGYPPCAYTLQRLERFTSTYSREE
jgi:uncharacterized protein (DUF1810 family)